MSEHNLVNAGRDFLSKAMSALLKDKSPDTLKYSLLYFWTGVELLLKAPLIDQHWSLVFADLNKADEGLYKTGNFISVDFDDAIARLRGICKISISDKEREILKVVRDQRNKLMHFGLLGEQSTIAVVTQAIDFLCRTYLRRAFPDESFNEISELAHRLDVYIQERWSKIRGIVDSARAGGRFIFRCPSCRQTSAILDKYVLHCKFCEGNEDDTWIIGQAIQEQPPDPFNHVEIRDGCCFDEVLELGTMDRKGLWKPELYVCCGCGKKGEQWKDMFASLCECGISGEHEHA